MISLENKFPQPSKPGATAARNQNSIGDKMEKKPWEKPGSVGGQFSSGQTGQVQILSFNSKDWTKI